MVHQNRSGLQNMLKFQVVSEAVKKMTGPEEVITLRLILLSAQR